MPSQAKLQRQGPGPCVSGQVHLAGISFRSRQSCRQSTESDGITLSAPRIRWRGDGRVHGPAPRRSHRCAFILDGMQQFVRTQPTHNDVTASALVRAPSRPLATGA